MNLKVYSYKVSEKLEKILKKLAKKDNKLYNQVMRKIFEVVNSDDIHHSKNLKYNMKTSKRVHVGHFGF